MVGEGKRAGQRLKALCANTRTAGDRAAGGQGLQVMGDRGEPAVRASLHVRAGEIVGVAGVSGNGQRELMERWSASAPIEGGRSGGPARPSTPRVRRTGA
jgi:ABC-type uncharacterized transport system ATPase subunit